VKESPSRAPHTQVKSPGSTTTLDDPGYDAGSAGVTTSSGALPKPNMFGKKILKKGALGVIRNELLDTRRSGFDQADRP
jgi:hypothetical protein